MPKYSVFLPPVHNMYHHYVYEAYRGETLAAYLPGPVLVPGRRGRDANIEPATRGRLSQEIGRLGGDRATPNGVERCGLRGANAAAPGDAAPRPARTPSRGRGRG